MFQHKRKKVLVAMSGGVDSSVAAALLLQQGYEVTGVTMKIWDEDRVPDYIVKNKHSACFGPEEAQDIEDARSVAEKLGFHYFTVDLRDAYRQLILDHVRDEYRSGRTPNPCIRCNRLLKFRALLDLAVFVVGDYDFYATGHYVRVRFDEASGRRVLRQALDKRKDQSYFLYFLDQRQLAACLFPLGEMRKEEVRSVAVSLGLPVAYKEESQDFVAGGISWLLRDETDPGPVIDGSGRTIGRHRGVAFYTVGQRRGLGVQSREPLFVTRLDRMNRAVHVGPYESIFSSRLEASSVHWSQEPPAHSGLLVKARIRYRHMESAALVTPISDTRALVEFKVPQPAITPGQSVVFYRGDDVLGGGVIDG